MRLPGSNFRLELLKARRESLKDNKSKEYEVVIQKSGPNSAYRYTIQVYDSAGRSLNRSYGAEAKADTLFGCKVIAKRIIKNHKKNMEAGEIVKTIYI